VTSDRPSPTGGRSGSLGVLRRHLRPGAPPARAESDAALAAQTILSTLGILVQGGVRFVFSVLVGNAFGKLVLGAANAAISLALFASLVHPSAAAQTATKFVARARGARDFEGAAAATAYLARWTALSSVALGVVGALVAPALLGLGAVESALTGALVVAYSGYMFTRGVLFGSGCVQRATVWDLISSAISLAALAAVVVAGETAWILLPLVLGYAVYVAANLPRRSRATVPADLRREMNGFLGLTLVNSVATGGFLQLSMVAAQHWDPEGAGAFAAALTLATPASLASRSLSLVLLPSLATAYGRGDHDSVRRQTDISTRVLAVVSLATFGPLMLLSPTLISLFFRRDGFDEAVILLPILLAAVMVLNVVIGATNSLLTREQRHARVVVAASVVGALAGAAWWLVAAPTGGVHAVAVGYLGGTLIVSVIPVVVAWRLDHHAWAGLVTRFVGMTAVAGALVWWEESTGASLLVQLLLAVGFVGCWIGISWKDARLTVQMLRHSR
jgi:putative peptidoglycan lipid II flippase